jgi:hypothetical protein
MGREHRIVRDLTDQVGTLKDDSGVATKVRFDLVQLREYVDGVPTVEESGSGWIGFRSLQDSLKFSVSGENYSLSGGGIEAKIISTSSDSFEVTGPIRAIGGSATKPGNK